MCSGRNLGRFGSEGREGAGPPLGLDKHEIAWYMRFLTENGFNAIRFLFNHETILSNPTLDPPNEELYGVGAPWEAPELENYKYLDMFLKLAEVAAEHGDRRAPSPAPQGWPPAELIPSCFRQASSSCWPAIVSARRRGRAMASGLTA